MQSKLKKTQRAIRTAKHLLIIAVATSALTSCCKIRSQMEVVIEEGYLYTPDGKYEFERLSYSGLREIEPRYRDKDPEPKTYMMATTNDFIFVANPAGGGASTWTIFTKRSASQGKNIVVDTDSSLFETRKNKELLGSGKAVFPQYLNMRTAQGNKITSSATHFSGASISSQIKGNTLANHTFRYVIPLLIDGEKYKIDITISIKKDRYMDCNDWHFPGTP